MAKFDIYRSIEPVHVSYQLLKEIEDLMMKRLDGFFPNEDAKRRKVEITLGDKDGIETVQSVEELNAKIFSNATKSVRVNFSQFSGDLTPSGDFSRGLIVNISFTLYDIFAQRLIIHATGRNSRDFAIGTQKDLTELFKRHSNHHGFFHPPTFVTAIIWLIYLVIPAAEVFFMATSIKVPNGPIIFSSLSILIGLYLLPLKIFFPYFTFDSRVASSRHSIIKWFVTFVVGTIIVNNVVIPWVKTEFETIAAKHQSR